MIKALMSAFLLLIYVEGKCQIKQSKLNTDSSLFKVHNDTTYIRSDPGPYTKTFVSYVVNTKYKKYSLFWGLIKFKVKQR